LKFSDYVSGMIYFELYCLIWARQAKITERHTRVESSAIKNGASGRRAEAWPENKKNPNAVM
jgi:hypothetical protein